MRRKFKVLSLISLMCVLIENGGTQKPDTALLKYKVSPQERTMIIKDAEKWKTFMLEDILGKKVYTKGIAASRFGGEREIELEKELLMKQLGTPPSLIKELPTEVKRKVAEITKEIKPEYGIETISPEAKLKPEEKAEGVKLTVEEREKMKLAAIKALGVVKTESAVFQLRESLKEEKPEIKRAAAEALAKMGESTGLEVLHAGLAEERVAPKVEAIKALGRVGRVTSIPPLRKLLDSEERKVSKEAALALAKMGDERGITVLHELIRSESFMERFESAVTLAEIEDPAGIEVLKNSLKSTSTNIRLKAVKALGIIGDKSIVPLLDEIMKRDPDAGVRIAASESILSIKRRGR